VRQVDTRAAELLRTIDPVALGSRLRAARIARGWTQSDLAGENFSVGYVSRIENGTRRPRMSALVALADRLEITVEELLRGASEAEVNEIKLGLSYAELALENGEDLEAEHQARDYVARAEQASLTDLAQEGRFLVARALESMGQLDDAILELESLMESTGGLLAVRCGIALCRIYREVGDLGLAIEVGERLQPVLAENRLEQSDEAIQLAMTVALAYIERGDLSRAARFCTEAIRTAEQLASPAARSAAYWNASIVYSERGDTQAALALADRALGLLGEGQDTRNLARLRLELGRLQLNLDPPNLTEALDHIRRGATELKATSASQAEVVQGDVALARALLLSGQPEQAVETASAARSANPGEATLGLAEAIIVQGEALAQLGRADDARAAYAQAAELLSQLGTDRWVAQAWCELGELNEALGDFEAARIAFRAAASASGLRLGRRSQSRIVETTRD